MLGRVVGLILVGALAFGGASAVAAEYSSASLPPPDVVTGGQVREYAIAPGDILTVSVFQVADLNRDVEVDASGEIKLPLIGPMKVAGKSTRVISDEIAGKLRDGYVLQPDVAVTIKGSPNQRVTVEGAVKEPGVYALSGRTTLLQAIALAKGPDTIADEKRVAVLRNVQNRRAAALFDLTAIREGRAEDPVIYGNDVVVVERSGAKSFLNNLRSVMPVLGIFRWF